MKVIATFPFLSWALSLSGKTATYTSSNQVVTLTGLGGSGGVGQSRVTWGNCVYDCVHTNCTITAPYTGVGGGGTISSVFTYSGSGQSPFTANSISAGSSLVTFGLMPGSSGTITVSLIENTGATVQCSPTTSLSSRIPPPLALDPPSRLVGLER